MGRCVTTEAVAAEGAALGVVLVAGGVGPVARDRETESAHLEPDDGARAVAFALRAAWWGIYSGVSGSPEDVARYERYLAAATSEAESVTAGWRAAASFLVGWVQLSDPRRHDQAVAAMEEASHHLPSWAPTLGSELLGALSVGQHLVGQYEASSSTMKQALATNPGVLESDTDDMVLRARALVLAVEGRRTEAHSVVLRLLAREQWMARPSYAGDAIVLAAALTIIAGDHERGALLLAGATQLGPVFGSPMTYGLYHRYRPIAQAALGHRARAVRDRGRAMLPDELIDLAKRPLRVNR